MHHHYHLHFPLFWHWSSLSLATDAQQPPLDCSGCSWQLAGASCHIGVALVTGFQLLNTDQIKINAATTRKLRTFPKFSQSPCSTHAREILCYFVHEYFQLPTFDQPCNHTTVFICLRWVKHLFLICPSLPKLDILNVFYAFHSPC